MKPLNWLVSVALALITLNASGFSSQAREEEPAAPKIIAVKFHADWCGFCKQMGPVFTDLQNKFDGEPVLFVTLDFTNGTTRHQAELLAAALGIGPVYQANQATGFILLLNGKTRDVITRLTSEQTFKEMSAALEEVLKKKSPPN